VRRKALRRCRKQVQDAEERARVPGMNAFPLFLAALMAAESGQSGPPANPAAKPAAEASAVPAPPDASAAGQDAAKGRVDATQASVDAALAKADAAWTERDLPGKLDEVSAALDTAAGLAPGSYAVLWRQAQLIGWRSEEPTLAKTEKSRLGKLGWEVGDQARALEPGKVEGHFFSMVGVGNYSLGIGVFSALAQGIEGKFRERLSRAEAIDPGFQAGAIPMSWGRFYYELPWPKHDARQSEKYLRDAIARHGENVRPWVYLGDLLLDEGRKDEARAAWQRAASIAVVPGAGDLPEQRRWQVVANQSLEKLSRK
jgi:tetratricopeptide (TPR) repeat protein